MEKNVNENLKEEDFKRNGWKKYAIPVTKDADICKKFYQLKLDDELYIDAFYYDLSSLPFNNGLVRSRWEFEINLDSVDSGRCCRIKLYSWEPKENETVDQFLVNLKDWVINLVKNIKL